MSMQASSIRCWRSCGAILLAAAVVLGPAWRAAALTAAEASGGFAELERRAQQAATQSYEPPPPLPERLRRLDYDDYRLISFEHEAAVWHDERRPFRLEFFHRGYLFGERVAVHVVDEDRVETIPFRRGMFQYRGRQAELQVPDDLGFAGLRVIGKLDPSRDFQEIASFLGASYFRAVGVGQVYGSSARGLAIDVGLPQAEEFPAFREYWIERPAATDDRLQFTALLESPSAVGAYQFVLRPGSTTAVDVRATVYFRRVPKKVGVAPLTSMWQWGDGLRGPSHDPRPEVHDSDGLLIRTAGDEWLWRSLARQSYPSLARFDLNEVRGFGLMQRDRTAEHYADQEARYERRPSLWIEPKGDWGAGTIELLELPSDHEGIDNIAVWWTPRKPLTLTEPLRLEYRVSFMNDEPAGNDLGRVVAMRARRSGGVIGVEVDFAGGSLVELAGETVVTPEVTALRGLVGRVECIRLSDQSRRLRFDLHPAGPEPVELSAVLRAANEPVTETWRYLCPTHH